MPRLISTKEIKKDVPYKVLNTNTREEVLVDSGITNEIERTVPILHHYYQETEHISYTITNGCLSFTTNNFFISKRDFKNIIENAISFEKLETGGNLFGNFDNHGNPIVFNVVNPISNCKRSPHPL
jgi:hypothetical protein